MTHNAPFVTTRFGAIEFAAEDVLTLSDGLLGFPEACRWVLVQHREGSAFRWLQSLDAPDLAFLVIDPHAFVPDFGVTLTHEQAKELGLDDSTPTLVYTICTIPQGKPEAMTINLAGPIVINAVTRNARQVVIEDPAYPIQYRVATDSSAARAA